MNRDFKGVWIPKKIWLDENLTWMEKLFLVEIDSLDENGECYASNKYFGEFFKLSNSRVSEIINSLIRKEYITSTMIREGRRVVKRILRPSTPKITEKRYSEKETKVFGKGDEPYSEKAKGINTLFNNTNINLSSKLMNIGNE